MLKENYNLSVELNGQKLNLEFNRSDLFRLTSFLVLPFWALMIIAPRAGITKKLMNSKFIFGLLGVYYTAILADIFATNPSNGSPTDLLNPKFEAINKLFATPQGTLVAWVHIATFDLFVGRWIYLDSLQRGKTARLALLLTLFVGPLGLLFYLATSGKKAESNQ
jgi:uncharacterized membrane protein